MTEASNVIDVDPIHEPVKTADSLETAASPAPPSPPKQPTVSGVDTLDVRVEQRFGYRNVRGKPTKVATQHLNILVDGQMHAWTFTYAGSDIFAIAEFLDHEIPQLQAAVKSYTGEDGLRSFRANNTPTQAEVEKLQKM